MSSKRAHRNEYETNTQQKRGKKKKERWRERIERGDSKLEWKERYQQQRSKLSIRPFWSDELGCPWDPQFHLVCSHQPNLLLPPSLSSFLSLYISIFQKFKLWIWVSCCAVPHTETDVSLMTNSVFIDKETSEEGKRKKENHCFVLYFNSYCTSI